jgi:hypothetical protein
VYNLIFSPGAVWDEPNGVDRGWTRAAAPFALSERNANCVLNGLLLFAFRSEPGRGTTAVSAVRFQVTAETCMYFQANYYGQLPATLTPTPPDTERLAAAREMRRREVSDRLPVASLATLADDFPGVDPNQFGGSLEQARVTARAVLVRGKLYVAECTTRTGNYGGHCAEMVVPSYSTAKYIMAGLTMGRLALIHGHRVYVTRISSAHTS